MKAITIWQPYATLLVHGDKLYETRSWATSYRGPIAIHAAKRPARQIIDALANGSVLDRQTAMLMERLLRRFGGADHLPTGAVLGTANLVRCNVITEEFLRTLTPQELALGDFTLARYAWEFENMMYIKGHVPEKGAQGLWEWRVDRARSTPWL